MKRIYSLLFFIPVFLLYSGAAFTQTGTLDPTFGNKGKVITDFDSTLAKARAVAIQADGKLVVVGSGESFPGGVLYVTRYNADGSIDGTFATGGTVSMTVLDVSDALRSIALQPDGKIVVGGFLHNYDSATQLADADFYLIRLKTDGTFDSTFGTNGQVLTDVSYHSGDILHKIIIKPDGKILAGGYSNDVSGSDAYALVQYNADGSVDSTFGTNGKSVTMLPLMPDGDGAMSLLPSGKILCAATFVNQTSFFYEFGAMRFNANGSLDSSFGNAGTKTVSLSNFHTMLHDMAVQSDGKIVLAGEVQDAVRTNAAVVRLDSTGTVDNTFGNNGNVHTQVSSDPYGGDAGTTVQVQPDGKILLGCTTDNAINSVDANFALVRYESNGNIDDTFGKHGIIITDFANGGDFSSASAVQPDGKVVLVGSAETTTGGGFGLVRYERNARLYYNTLNGSVFLDNNSNGTKDAGENYLGNASLIAMRPGVDTTTITSSTGLFEADIDTGSYVITPSAPVPYYTAVPAMQTLNHSSYFNSDSISFAMQPIPGIKDMFVYIIPLTPARPGFNADYEIVFGNNGTDTVASGTVRFIKNSKSNIISSVPVANSTVADTLQWNFTNLLPRDTGMIIVHANIQAPPSVAIGDSLYSFATINPRAGDYNVEDNQFTLLQEAVGSYDPNDKSENHGGKIALEKVSSGEYLYYTIRFQNTGTDTAFNIYVRDTLSSNVDINSMQMISASHNYSLTVNEGKCLWSFNNIQLVDSNKNVSKSHGYIVYRIKPKTTLTIGDNIDNTASIYFDYNLPVRTNTERTTVTANSFPLKLVSFTAKKNGRVNTLRWNTSNEINASHFNVERSSNGRDYINIGKVNAGLNEYLFNDNNPAKSMNYYRLKMVDRDGSVEYSPIRTINNSGSLYVNIYPNPVKERLNLQVEAEKQMQVHIQITSLDGKILMSKTVEAAQGTSIRSFDVSNLKPSIYFVKTETADREIMIIKFEKL